MNHVLVLDFDGVIVDSLALKGRGLGEVLKGRVSLSSQEIMRFHLENPSMTARDKIQSILQASFGGHGFMEQVEVLSQEVDHYHSEFRSWLAKRPPKLVPGIKSTIRNLGKFMRLDILSAAPDSEIRDILIQNELLSHFGEIHGSESAKARALAAKTEEFVASGLCLLAYVGDSPSDLAAARTSKTQFIGFGQDLKGLHSDVAMTPLELERSVHELRTSRTHHC